MKRTLIIAAIVVIGALVVWQVIAGRGGEVSGRYEFVEIRRGDLENIISSTGTLSAVGTVEVGTQVSGTIEHVLVDYNESVREDQILAVLDTTLLAASVRDAKANVLKMEAQRDQAARDHERSRDLFRQELISKAGFDDSETSVMTARAALLSAEAGLDRARANLDYAVIRSPIDGTVIMRTVESGQTVAASFSTPTLFVIAEDLSDMEIHALVDESDIGQIRVGQTVRFTVEAYMDDVFHGKVRQIWLQPETVQNVVNYTVVVDAANEHGLLYPGMTATTDFLVDQRNDVLLVPNAALRFQPTQDMITELQNSMRERVAALPDSERERAAERMGRRGEGRSGDGPGPGMGGHGAGAQFGSPGGAPFGWDESLTDDVARLWYVDARGRLSVARVVKGATDGRVTEIVEGRDVEEGMQVIRGVVEVAERDTRRSNPLAASMGRRGPGR